MYDIIERSCEQVASPMRSGSNDIQVVILRRVEGLALSGQGLGNMPNDTLVYLQVAEFVSTRATHLRM